MASSSPSKSPSGLIALSTVVPILCIGAVILRFRLRKKHHSPTMMDDWIMVPALALFIGMCICAILGVKRRVWGYATPYTEADSDPDAFNQDSIYEGKLLESYQFLQTPALGCIKLGALFFYHRIFSPRGGSKTSYSLAIQVFVVITSLWIIAITTMNGLQCGKHITALWSIDPATYVQYCIYAFRFEEGFAISNFLLDFFIILLPVPKIWALQMPTGRKVALTGVFGLALVGFAGSIARMIIYLKIVANGPSLTADFRLEDTESVFWSSLEAGLSLLAVNLPSLWAYVNKASPESIIASIRSIISLRSLRSDGSSNPSRSHLRIPDGDLSMPSTKIYAGASTGRLGVESHAMHVVEGQEGRPPLPAEAIMIKKSFVKSNDIV